MEPARPSGLTVLLADDSPELRTMLTDWLRRAGHTVIGAASGGEAAAVLRRTHVDVVITDVVMPGGDGIELIRDFRVSRPKLRFVAISGGGQGVGTLDCLALARDAGADCCLLKPFTPPELLAALWPKAPA